MDELIPAELKDTMNAHEVIQDINGFKEYLISDMIPSFSSSVLMQKALKQNSDLPSHLQEDFEPVSDDESNPLLELIQIAEKNIAAYSTVRAPALKLFLPSIIEQKLQSIADYLEGAPVVVFEEKSSSIILIYATEENLLASDDLKIVKRNALLYKKELLTSVEDLAKKMYGVRKFENIFEFAEFVNEPANRKQAASGGGGGGGAASSSAPASTKRNPKQLDQLKDAAQEAYNTFLTKTPILPITAAVANALQALIPEVNQQTVIFDSILTPDNKREFRVIVFSNQDFNDFSDNIKEMQNQQYQFMKYSIKEEAKYPKIIAEAGGLIYTFEEFLKRYAR